MKNKTKLIILGIMCDIGLHLSFYSFLYFLKRVFHIQININDSFSHVMSI